MTKAERDELRELEKAATPGPWPPALHPEQDDVGPNDWPLINAARNALVPLLDLADEADKLRAVLEAAKGVVGGFGEVAPRWDRLRAAIAAAEG